MIAAHSRGDYRAVGWGEPDAVRFAFAVPRQHDRRLVRGAQMTAGECVCTVAPPVGPQLPPARAMPCKPIEHISLHIDEC